MEDREVYMKKIKSLILASLLVIVILVSLIFYSSATFQKQSFEEKREKLLEQLYSNINEAILEGRYECCIEPPCTMCYLGHWIWDDGTCACDEMIAKGELDKVCPQCKRGIEEGECKSANESFCEISFD